LSVPAGGGTSDRAPMSLGLSVLAVVFIGAAVLGAPVGLSMLAAGFAYLIASHQDLGLVVDQTMNGLYNSYLLLAVPLFIFVANLMNASSVLERLLVFAQAIVGRFRGGLAHVNVLCNLIFSGMSGSALADAAGPGLIVARMMIRDGRYPAGFAAATSVASATIGPLVPPSIAMIFYALIANASVGALFIAGLVPAAMMAAALMACIAVIARRRNFPAEPPMPWRVVPTFFVRALLPLALPAILLGIIYSGIASPTEAAAIAAAYALLLAFAVYRSMNLSRLIEVIADTVTATATIGLIMAGAFVFNYAIANEGVPRAIRNGLVAWNLSPVTFLLCVNVMLLLLAILIDEITILLVIVPLLVPVARSLGIDVVHFGVVIVLNMMVGLALPPHGLLLFVMNGLTGTPLGEIFREMPAFVASMLAVLLLATLCPNLVLTLPRLLGYAAS
jgi:C4-dicarboxylate transporter DctM subunit